MTGESNLVAHARRELELANVEKDVRPSIIKAVQAFAEYGHSGGSASVCVPMLADLLNFQALSPLTDNPREWVRVEDMLTNGRNMWQSVRQSDAFSEDGGDTYYRLSEERRWLGRILPWRVWRNVPHTLRFPRHKTNRAGFIIGVSE